MGAKASAYDDDQYEHEDCATDEEETEEGNDEEQQEQEQEQEWEGEDWKVDPMTIFISYKWKTVGSANVTQNKCILLRDRLKAEGFNVWLDVDQMKGNIQKTMARNVYSASVVLICFSDDYEDSPNCMFELSCAFAYKLALGKTTKRKIIPVKLDDSKPQKKGSLLKKLVKSHIYYDLSADDDDEKYEENMEKLVEQLNKFCEKKRR